MPECGGPANHIPAFNSWNPSFYEGGTIFSGLTVSPDKMVPFLLDSKGSFGLPPLSFLATPSNFINILAKYPEGVQFSREMQWGYPKFIRVGPMHFSRKSHAFRVFSKNIDKIWGGGAKKLTGGTKTHFWI